jgi:hypothetical protein
MRQPNTPPQLGKCLHKFARLLITSFALSAVVYATDNTDYQNAVASGKSKLDAGKIDEALSDFQYAVLLDGNQSEGFFYLAVASFRLGDHAAALEYGQAAVAVAKDREKLRAQELVDAIRKAKETEDLARQGDEAYGKGLNAKAADLYARAFQRSPDRGDLGLKAATLYGNRLGRLFEAAVLYQEVIASGDAEAAATAGLELGALHEPLQKLYREELPRAVERHDLSTLEKLSKAFPHELQPRLEVAALRALSGDGGAVADWLGEAVKLGADYDEVKARAVFLDLWENDSPAFKAFIDDAFGSTAVSDMNQRLKTRQAKLADERRVAAEKARAEQAAREKRQREEQLAREQAAREEAAQPLRAQLRKPVVAELDRLLQASAVKRIGYRAEAKFFGGSEKNFSEYHVSIGLQENGYIVKHTNVFEHWRYAGAKTYETKTFHVESFSALVGVTVSPVYSGSEMKGLYGPAEKFFSLALAFPGYTIPVVIQNTASSDATRAERSNNVYAQFIIKEPVDGRRIAELFWELKAIDSLTLEELRVKVGSGQAPDRG